MLSIEYIRQFRFSGYAIFDLLVSLLGIYLLSPLLSKIFLKIRIDIPQKNWVFLTLPIGIVMHVVFGTMTPMTQDFLDFSGHYFLKILILGLLLFGLKGIKVVKKMI